MSESDVERYQRELEVINSLPDREKWLWYIQDVQGESPRDRAWPTEGGNEPEPEAGWDPSGTYHFGTVHKMYLDLQVEGKIPCTRCRLEELAIERWNRQSTALCQVAVMLGISELEAQRVLDYSRASAGVTFRVR